VFIGLNPFEIRKQSAYDVFLIMRRLNTSSKTKQGKKKSRLKRPASDNWF